jgi:hypothetical protein
MKTGKVVTGVLGVVLAATLTVTHAAHTEMVNYVPTITIVHNGGEVVTATAAALLMRGKG